MHVQSRQQNSWPHVSWTKHNILFHSSSQSHQTVSHLTNLSANPHHVGGHSLKHLHHAKHIDWSHCERVFSREPSLSVRCSWNHSLHKQKRTGVTFFGAAAHRRSLCDTTEKSGSRLKHSSSSCSFINMPPLKTLMYVYCRDLSELKRGATRALYKRRFRTPETEKYSGKTKISNDTLHFANKTLKVSHIIKLMTLWNH